MKFHDFIFQAVDSFQNPLCGGVPLEHLCVHPERCYEPDWKDPIFHNLLVYTDENLGKFEATLFGSGKRAKASVQGAQFYFTWLDD